MAEQTWINVNISNTNSTQRTPSNTGFDDIFQEVTDSNNNIFYILKDVTTSMNTGMNHGMLINFPIPPNFQTLKGRIINGTKKTLIIPLLIFNHQGQYTESSRIHPCSFAPEFTGKTCTLFIQQNTSDIIYFKSDMSPTNIFPNITGDELSSRLIQNYNAEIKKTETYYFLPTICPNNRIIYLVASDENKIKEQISRYGGFLKKKLIDPSNYFIGVNGFFFEIDSWESTFVFIDKEPIKIWHKWKSISISSDAKVVF